MLSWEDRVGDCLGLYLQERSQGTALRLESDKLGSLERRAELREQLGDALRISRGIFCRVLSVPLSRSVQVTVLINP